MQVIVKMYALQELVRKTFLEGLVNSVVIQFKDNRMKIEAIGVEDKQSVDNTLSINISYPCETIESGEIALNGIGDFLSKLELFERDDVVSLTTLKNELIITRTSPSQTLTYELADPKFIKTYSTGLKTIFGNPIRLVKLDGKEKIIKFDSSVTLDAQKLKEHGSKIGKIEANSIPLQIKDGKLITNLKGETSGLIREVEGVISTVGNASSVYGKELLTILKHGIGTAVLRFSEGSPLHINFTHETMSADYLIQTFESK